MIDETQDNSHFKIISLRWMDSEILLIAKIFALKFGFLSLLDFLQFGINEIIFHFSETVFLNFSGDFASVVNPLICKVVI